MSVCVCVCVLNYGVTFSACTLSGFITLFRRIILNVASKETTKPIESILGK